MFAIPVPDFKVGDRVVHYRDVTRIGTVVLVELRGFVVRDWRYFVEWEPGASPVPMKPGTWRAPGAHHRVPAPRAAEAAPST